MAKKSSAKGGKSKSKNQSKGGPRRRPRNLPPRYLALTLIFFLLIEAGLGTYATTADWQAGAAVLDVTSGLSIVSNDISATIQPAVEMYDNISQFYRLAANEMMLLLDLSESHPWQDADGIFIGVSEFYQLSADQLSFLLDPSVVSIWPSRVAGISISAQ